MAYTDSAGAYGAGGAAPGPGGARDRITQALMAVQNPPPVPDVQMPPPAGAPPPVPGAAAPGGMPPAAAGAPGMGGMAPGTPPMLPQLGSATPPGMQPGGMLSTPPAAPSMPLPGVR